MASSFVIVCCNYCNKATGGENENNASVSAPHVLLFSSRTAFFIRVADRPNAVISRGVRTEYVASPASQAAAAPMPDREKPIERAFYNLVLFVPLEEETVSYPKWKHTE